MMIHKATYLADPHIVAAIPVVILIVSPHEALHRHLSQVRHRKAGQFLVMAAERERCDRASLGIGEL